MSSRFIGVFPNHPFVSDTMGANRVPLVVFLSGLLGFCVGMFGHATWQVAVEGAQVVAGIVKYPRQNPYYIYQTKIWTLLHQISALFLFSGVSEKTLSFLVTGLEGMLSFQALSLCVLALSQNPVLAIVSPFFIYFTRAAQFGVIYPVSLVGPFTYGIVGLSFALLVLALISIGQYKLGGLLLGVAPAVHPSLGMLLWLTVLICFLWDFRDLYPTFKKAMRYLLFGCAVSVISLAFHLSMAYDVPKISAEDALRYLYAFLRYWDGHRRPLDSLLSVRYLPGIYMNVAVLAICLGYLTLCNRDVPERSSFLMRAFVVSSILGLGFAIVSVLPMEMIPQGVLILMPARWLNVSVLGFMALLIGLLDWYKDDLWAQWSLTTLIVSSWIFAPAREAAFTIMAIFSFAFMVIFISRARGSARLGEFQYRSGPVSAMGLRKADTAYLSVSRWFLDIPRGIAMLVLGVMMIQTGLQTHASWKVKKYQLTDWTNDPLFAEASRGSGMLLTSSNLGWIQLRTRRPVLLDGHGLDSLPYALETGPEMDRILQQVYGVDLFNPPEEIKNIRPGALLPETGKTLWESRTREEWDQIRKQFGVTQVLTYANWSLKLPEVIRNKEFVLYRIPESQ